MGSSARKKRERKRRNMGRGAPDLPASSGAAHKNALPLFEDRKKGSGAVSSTTASRGIKPAAATAGGGRAAGPVLSRAERRQAARDQLTTQERMLQPSSLLSTRSTTGSQPASRVIAGLAAKRKRELAALAGDEAGQAALALAAAGTEPPRAALLKKPSLRAVVASANLASKPKFGVSSALDLWGGDAAATEPAAKRARRRAVVPVLPSTRALLERGGVPTILDPSLHTTTPLPPSLKHRRTSALPAVPAPSHGESYHPDRKAHAKELSAAVQTALQQQEEQARLHRETRRKPFPYRLTTSGAAKARAQNGDEDDGSEDEQGGVAVAPVQPERKTKKQRAKERARKLAAKAKRHARFLALRQRDLDNLDEIVQDVEVQTQASQSICEARRAEKAARQLTATRRVGRIKFEAPHAAVALPEQLHGEMRRVEAPKYGAPNPLEAHFKRLQARNIIEPTTGQQHPRRYALRVYNKRSAAMD